MSEKKWPVFERLLAETRKENRPAQPGRPKVWNVPFEPKNKKERAALAKEYRKRFGIPKDSIGWKGWDRISTQEDWNYEEKLQVIRTVSGNYWDRWSRKDDIKLIITLDGEFIDKRTRKFEDLFIMPESEYWKLPGFVQKLIAKGKWENASNWAFYLFAVAFVVCLLSGASALLMLIAYAIGAAIGFALHHLTRFIVARFPSSSWDVKDDRPGYMMIFK